MGQTNKQKGANNNIVIYDRPRLKNIQNIDDKPIKYENIMFIIIYNL